MGQSRRDTQWPKPAAVRHVWVQSPEHHDAPVQGLVLGWERRSGRWRAQVIMVIDDRSNASPMVLQRWMRLEDLAPAPSRPRSPDRDRWHLGWVDDPNGEQWQHLQPPSSRDS